MWFAKSKHSSMVATGEFVCVENFFSFYFSVLLLVSFDACSLTLLTRVKHRKELTKNQPKNKYLFIQNLHTGYWIVTSSALARTKRKKLIVAEPFRSP